MNQYNLFAPHFVNLNSKVHIAPSGRHYTFSFGEASEVWSRYPWLHKEMIDNNLLPYISDYNSADVIYYLERGGIGPVCHLSYSRELDCIMGVGTRKGYEREGLASYLLEWFIAQTTGEVKISSFSEQGRKHLASIVRRLAVKHKVNVMQYNYEDGMINLRFDKGFMEKKG